MKIHKHINSFFSSITYILYSDDMPNVWLTDCGDAENIIQWLQKNKKTLSGVFITHSHYDHIYGLNALKKVYSQMKIYVSANGTKGLYSSKLNMSQYHQDVDDFVYEYEDIIEIQDTDNISLWQDVRLEVISTPGHDWSCLTYKVGDYLFTGDSYIPQIKVVTNFPKSNKEEAIASLEKILFLAEKENLTICSGH